MLFPPTALHPSDAGPYRQRGEAFDQRVVSHFCTALYWILEKVVCVLVRLSQTIGAVRNLHFNTHTERPSFCVFLQRPQLWSPSPLE